MTARVIRSTWAIPALLAAGSVVGLVAALAGDGAADWISWAGLAAPVAATGWAIHARRC